MNETRSPAHAQLDERIRQPMRPLREFAVGELCLAVDDADLVAEEQRGAVRNSSTDSGTKPPRTSSSTKQARSDSEDRVWRAARRLVFG